MLVAGQLPTANEKQKLSLDKPFTGARVLAAGPLKRRATGSWRCAPASQAPRRGPEEKTRSSKGLVPSLPAGGKRAPRGIEKEHFRVWGDEKWGVRRF